MELQETNRQRPPAVQPAPAPAVSATDEELLKIAAQLDVCIKIIGCGGGGCNTINRCVDAGISGAQLCAINTDAKHLLTIRAPKKILIGKSKTRGLGQERGQRSERSPPARTTARSRLPQWRQHRLRHRGHGGRHRYRFRTLRRRHRQGADTGSDARHRHITVQGGRNGPHGERIVRTEQAEAGL